MKDTRFAQFVIFVNSAVPLGLLSWDAYHHRLGANPFEFATRTTGVLTLLFLLLSLAVTPLRKALGLGWMIKFRRLLGLYGFFYGAVHLLTYVWFDKFFAFRVIGEDIVKRPFITVGMASFVMLVPLALTSTQKSIKRIGGKRWNLLHRLVYFAAAGGVIHYYMLVKADTREPILFGVVLALLLAYRILNRYLPAYTQRTPARGRARAE
ncbi:MAG TPA: protein-methionine-sulfoxide reductase heme-binding subunit MsrQ [Blastocatellia bacterium]|jgi:sulfoxide reductase heme-binding subunit YedZ|nr:protein-methionine-sulfoxide reductase heme-binding subunit MsrQ [Blastocatellia bacterium]